MTATDDNPPPDDGRDAASRSTDGAGTMSLSHAVAIGVGGMIGAGVFSIMGVAGEVAGGATGLAFLLAGALALLCAYSFGKLGSRYPSSGGPVEYLVKGLGDNVFSGGFNVMLWLGYILALAVYVRAFAAYAATFAPEAWAPWLQPGLSVAVVSAFLLLNIVGAEAVGRLEVAIVAIKLLILVGFIAAAAPGVDFDRLSPGAWPGPGQIGFAAAVVFMSYEGFGLITNTAEDLHKPRRDLPRALLISVSLTIVIYVLAALCVMGNLSVEQVKSAEEYALAEAVRPTLGQTGFTIIALAALFSTASAINATLYGGANVSYTIARHGNLPAVFQRRIWQRARGGLVLTAALVAALALLFDLAGIAIMGSAAFLLVYGAVNLSHLRLLDQTKASAWAIWAGVIGCAGVFALLVIYMIKNTPRAFIGLGVLFAVSLVGEMVWRRARKTGLSTRRS